MKILKQSEKQQILARHITLANGRPRELLDRSNAESLPDPNKQSLHLPTVINARRIRISFCFEKRQYLY